MIHETTLNELKERVGTILDLKRVSALVGWDQQTMMPPAGNDARADQLATIDRFSHELFVSARRASSSNSSRSTSPSSTRNRSTLH